MAKPPAKGNDATQELTMDQLVASLPPKTPTAPPKQVGPQNDISTWGRNVVGADEFVPDAGQAKRPLFADSSSRWPLVVGLIAAIAVGVVVLLVVTNNSDESPSTDEAKTVAPAPGSGQPAPGMRAAPGPAIEPSQPTKPSAVTAKPPEPAKPPDVKTEEPAEAAKPVDTKPAVIAETKPAPAMKPVAKKPVAKKPVAKKPIARKPVKKPAPKRR